MSASEQEVIINAPAEVPTDVRTAVAAILDETDRALVVTSDAEYSAAGEYLVSLVGHRKELDAKRRLLVDPLNATVKRINNWFRDPIAKCDAKRERIDRAMGDHETRKRREREEAERVAAEAARKEQERLQREAALQAQKAREERERAEAKAQALADAGKAERAEAAREQAEQRERERMAEAERTRVAAYDMPQRPAVQVETPKVKGVSARKAWAFEVMNEDEVPRQFLMVDEQKIRKYVATMGKDTDISGVRVYEKRISSARSR